MKTFEENAQLYPEKVAVVCEKRSITYFQLNTLAFKGTVSRYIAKNRTAAMFWPKNADHVRTLN